MSAVEATETPSRPTSPSARGSSGSNPMRVGMSNAVESPVCPCASRKLKRRLVSFGRAEPGEHPHRPELAAVHAGVGAARERVLARISQLRVVAPAGPKVGRAVGRRERNPRQRLELSVVVRHPSESQRRRSTSAATLATPSIDSGSNPQLGEVEAELLFQEDHHLDAVNRLQPSRREQALVVGERLEVSVARQELAEHLANEPRCRPSGGDPQQAGEETEVDAQRDQRTPRRRRRTSDSTRRPRWRAEGRARAATPSPAGRSRRACETRDRHRQQMH